MTNPRKPKDHTAAARQSRRRKQWADKIKAAGWASESQYVTAVINGKATIPTPQDSDNVRVI